MKFNKFVSLTLVCSLITTVGGCSLFEKKPDLSEEHFTEALQNVGASEIRKSDIGNWDELSSLVEDGYYYVIDDNDPPSDPEYHASLIEERMQIELPSIVEYEPNSLVSFGTAYMNSDDVQAMIRNDDPNYIGSFNISGYQMSFDDNESAEDAFDGLIDNMLNTYLIGRGSCADYDQYISLKNMFGEDLNCSAIVDFDLKDWSLRSNGNFEHHMIYAGYESESNIVWFEINVEGHPYIETELYPELSDRLEEIFNSLDMESPLNDSSLVEVNIGSRKEMSSLTNYRIPEGVEYVADYSFENGYIVSEEEYWHHITSIEIPDTVTRIGNYSFSRCVDLTSIDIPDDVTYIGDFAFCDCYSLESVHLPANYTGAIGTSAFAYCSSLTDIRIPSGVTSIGDTAFLGCESLETIEIPDGVTEIGINSFGFCNQLTTLVIPDSVDSFGFQPFIGCSSLESINGMDPCEWAESRGLDPVELGLT